MNRLKPHPGTVHRRLLATASSAPQVALAYNSQAGNSVAGYGWGLSGIPSISVTNKTIHYDGTAAPVDISNSYNSVFTLDGVRLVTNNNTSAPGYHYETAQGYTLVKRIMAGNDISHFEALFPDGSVATFGFTSNTSPKISYPLTSITDINGYRTDFEYIQSGNMYFISRIRYGSRTTTHPCEIRFEYVTRTDYTTAYVSTLAISQDRLLKSVVSYDGQQELRTYTLTHDLVGEVNRLVRLDCSSGNSSLNPLFFDYDYYSPNMTRGDLTNSNLTFISPYFENTPENKLQFIRGKLRKDNYNDGLIIYPGRFNTYGLVANNNNSYKFGSQYPGIQQIIIVPEIDIDNYNNFSILADTGFQTINAVDVDGDGTDEIVKVNFNGTSGTKTVLKVTVYTLTSGTGYTTRTFNVNVEGKVTSGSFDSPISREYHFGDFRGNGKATLLTVSHDKAFTGEDRISYFALIDLDAGTLISERTLFQLHPSDGKYVHAYDADGDGKTDLCHATSTGYDVYRFSTYYFSLRFSSTALTSAEFDRDVKFGDLNGDGKLDILVPPLTSYQDIRHVEVPVWAPHYCPICGGYQPITSLTDGHCRHCGHDLHDYYEQDPDDAYCRDCGYPLQPFYDPNPPYSLLWFSCPLHGTTTYADIDYGYVDNGNTWTCYINTGKGFTASYQNITDVKKDDRITVTDVNRDGLSDMILVRGILATLFLNSKGTIQDTSATYPTYVPYGTSEFIQANVVNYFSPSSLICVMDAEIRTMVFSRDEGKANLLTSMTDSHGMTRTYSYFDMAEGGYYIPTSTTHQYPYSSAIFPLNLLAESSVRMSHYGGLLGRTYYAYHGAVVNRHGLGFAGFEKVETTDGLRNTTVEENRDPEMFGATVSVLSPTKDTYYTYSPNGEGNGQANPRPTSASEHDKLAGVRTNVSYRYDQYGNPTQITQSVGDALATVTTQTYFSSLTSSRFISGQPLVKTVTTMRGGQGSWTDKEEITYDATTRLPLSRTTYTGTAGTGKTGETRWTYDASTGNVASETSAPYDVTDFIGTSYTYDNSGRFLATSTDALGLTTTYSSRDKYGNPRTVTDHRNNATTYTYDDWGRTLSETRPDGTVSTTTLAWGGEGLYKVTSASTGSPATITHYDAAGRVVREETQRFDGSWQKVDHTYDSLGRESAVSLPFTGNSPLYWDTYKYDRYDRPVRLTEASGRVTAWRYDGLSVTDSCAGIVTTRTTDASGALVSVTDPGGTITYTLRPDGQPSSITAPGGAVTSFGYDALGRRTSITDPSAGTRTFSENYTAAGVMTSTVTDADGKTVTTTYDRHGRVTSVARPEFYTAYDYDTDGTLTAEYSDNGTSAFFAYDTYGRLTTTTESAPGGRWLQTYLTYSSGNVSSAQYTSHNGTIATETYSYAYGHNTAVTLDGATTIWRLTGENDLGQPTQAVTGPMTRTYSYDAYGVPTGRTAGNVQNFSYVFDQGRLNLTSRTDNTRNIQETFSYDAMNRLTGAGGQTITYAANGNITHKDGAGTLTYGNGSRPYQVTALSFDTGVSPPPYDQRVTYTSFGRPDSVSEGGVVAAFTYYAGGDRARMTVTQGNTTLADRFYIGGRYETDIVSGKEILYLGGDAYSAPAAYVREDNVWKVYYICRDYLGSITHIANSDGSLKAEYSYDAWGRLRDPATHAAYAQGSEPAPFLGRGYTGHEHLTWFGVINANARLYDPVLGRFLSPDPYVQAPDNTQNFNRYSYVLNNPLKYTDPDGEWIHLLIGAVIGGVVNWATHGCEFTWKGLGYFGVGAATGALGAGIGAGISSALPIAGQASGGFAAGFLGTSVATTATSSFVSGALIGGGAGLASGFTTGFGNDLLQGGSFGHALGQGGIYGAIGLGSGALIGGLWGGIDAAIDGRRFWDGATVQRTTLAEHNIPVVGQVGDNNCLPASAEAVDRSFGGSMTQQDVRNLPTLGGDPNTVPLGDVDVWSAYGNRSGHFVTGEIPRPGVNSPANVLSNIQSGNRVAINLSTGDVGHCVVMQRVVQQTATKINGNVTQKLLYYVMNPANGGSITRISSRSIINAYNIFYILP